MGRLNYHKFGTYFANGQNFVVMVGLVYALHLTIPSLGIFKNTLDNLYYLRQNTNHLNVAIDRYSSILHTRLRLNCCTLNYHLFKINCIESSSCVCGDPCESVLHYFFCCPQYTALRPPLLSVAAQLLGERWNHSSDNRKTNFAPLWVE